MSWNLIMERRSQEISSSSVFVSWNLSGGAKRNTQMEICLGKSFLITSRITKTFKCKHWKMEYTLTGPTGFMRENRSQDWMFPLTDHHLYLKQSFVSFVKPIIWPFANSNVNKCKMFKSFGKFTQKVQPWAPVLALLERNEQFSYHNRTFGGVKGESFFSLKIICQNNSGSQSCFTTRHGDKLGGGRLLASWGQKTWEPQWSINS